MDRWYDNSIWCIDYRKTYILDSYESKNYLLTSFYHKLYKESSTTNFSNVSQGIPQSSTRNCNCYYVLLIHMYLFSYIWENNNKCNCTVQNRQRAAGQVEASPKPRQAKPSLNQTSPAHLTSVSLPPSPTCAAAERKPSWPYPH